MSNPLNSPETSAFHYLLVEDSDIDAKVTKRAFEEINSAIRITHVVNADEAMRVLEKADRADSLPNLILLDINMPGQSGMELLKEIKSTVSFRHIPVVMLSSSNSPEDVRQSYYHGAASYLQKPVHYNECVQAFRSLCLYWQHLNELP